jgi:AcrR family transcriptional regulator
VWRCSGSTWNSRIHPVPRSPWWNRSVRPASAGSPRTRDWILQAAAQVLAAHGCAAGTTNRIAERSGVSIGTLYQNYPNKDAILVELMTAHLDAGPAAIRARLDDGLPTELDALLRLFVRAAIHNHRDEWRLHQVLFEEAPRPAAILAMLHEDEAALVAAAAPLLAAHPQVTVGDADVAAGVVVATVESLVHRLVAAPEPMDPQVVEDELVRMVVAYLSAGT